VRTELVRIATLKEFEVIDRFFTIYCDPNMCHTRRLLYTFCVLAIFSKFILLTDFLSNLALSVTYI
jgi:hypothetical protein